MSRISALVLLLFAAGCSLTPTESDVRTKIAGNFCNDNYRLELSNAHYRNTRKNGGIPPEICEGTYALALGEGRWEIHYLPDTLNGVIATQCEKNLHPLDGERWLSHWHRHRHYARFVRQQAAQAVRRISGAPNKRMR